MNTRAALVLCTVTCCFTMPALAQEPDIAAAQPVNDAAITSAVKTRLAAYQVTAPLEVESGRDGTVWLSGTAPTQEAADRAVEVARNADGVNWVKSRIVVRRELK